MMLCLDMNDGLKKQPCSSCLQNDDEDFNYVIAFFLGTAACLYQVSDRLR